jgi:hypothetical protein
MALQIRTPPSPIALMHCAVADQTSCAPDACLPWLRLNAVGVEVGHKIEDEAIFSHS